MDKIFKQLKMIRPDRGYTENSRRTILNTLPPEEMTIPLSPWRMVVHSFQFSTAVALASILLILVFGGFSTWKFLSPFRLAGVDPVTIRAEADAIDAQLQLTDITYAAEMDPNLSQEVKDRAENLGIPTPASSSETTVEDALDLLAE